MASLILSVRVDPILYELNIGHNGLWSLTTITSGAPTRWFWNLRRAKSMPVASRSSCGYWRSAFHFALDAITTGFADSKSSPCRSIAPRPVACASVTTNIFFFVSKYLNSISFLKLCNSSSKHYCCVNFHLKWVFLQVNSHKGADFCGKFSMKSELDGIMHKKTKKVILIGWCCDKVKCVNLRWVWFHSVCSKYHAPEIDFSVGKATFFWI